MPHGEIGRKGVEVSLDMTAHTIDIYDLFFIIIFSHSIINKFFAQSGFRYLSFIAFPD